MELLVHTLNNGAVIAQDGGIEYTNPRVTSSRVTPQDLVGRPMAGFIAPAHRETVADRHRTRLASDALPLRLRPPHRGRDRRRPRVAGSRLSEHDDGGLWFEVNGVVGA